MAEEKKEESPSKKPVATKEDIEKNKGMAIIAYLIFFIPLLTDSKDSPYAKYHVKQAIMLWIFILVGWLTSTVLLVVLIGFLLYFVVGIMSVIFLIMGIINASNGEMKPLPIIGKWGEDWFKF